MDNQIFLQILGVIGTWLAGIGTISAVIVSLYLSRSDRRILLNVHAGHRVLILQNLESRPDYCSIGVVNKGHRSANIVNIGWKVGFFKKRYGIQTLHNNPFSSKLPIKLKDGEEANYLIPFINDDSYPNWIDDFPKGMLGNYPQISSRTLKLQILTSVGKTFESKIEEGLRKKIVEATMKEQ